MVLLRRFLVLVVLIFWQGGFVFYASVVVPVGTDVFRHYHPLGTGNEHDAGKRQQGRITRTVAGWLNLSCAIALVPLGWDVFAGTDASSRRRRWRGLLCLAVAVVLAALLWLYPHMDAQFNRDSLTIDDEGLFRVRHRTYLWLVAAQWGCCVVYLFLTLCAWRAEDVNAAKRALSKTWVK